MTDSLKKFIVEASIRETEPIEDLLSEGLVDIDDLYDSHEEQRREERRKAAAEDQSTAQERHDAIKQWIEF